MQQDTQTIAPSPPKGRRLARALVLGLAALLVVALALVWMPRPLVVGQYALVGPSCRTQPVSDTGSPSPQVVARVELAGGTSLLFGEDGSLLTARRLSVRQQVDEDSLHPRLLWHGRGFYLIRHR
jgi:hypothetical protein